MINPDSTGGYRPRVPRGHIPPGDTVPASRADIKENGDLGRRFCLIAVSPAPTFRASRGRL